MKKRLRNEMQSKKREKERERGRKPGFWRPGVGKKHNEKRYTKARFLGDEGDWIGPRPFRTLSTRNKKRLRNEIQSKKREKERERGPKTRFWVAAPWNEERAKKRRFVGPK